MAQSPRSRITRIDVAVLIGCLTACYAVAAIGGAITATSVETWYGRLDKPPLTPPDWVFAPVWLVLYAMMAVSAWLVYLRRRHADVAVPLALFVLQLIFNLAWPLLFFGLRWIEAALVGIGVLLVLVALTTVVFWRVDRRAGLLFAPYLLWVAFATYLNGGIWLLH